ncbi:hypothetical protein X740_16230 [Mesorhizobium sp. LNHC221B00]|nr:hypothetical protein X740_16230 [Mesorhizobium sp. LNHC221B00]
MAVGQEPVVADAMESVRKSVQQEARDELYMGIVKGIGQYGCISTS